jgi:hypothetical protein
MPLESVAPDRRDQFLITDSYPPRPGSESSGRRIGTRRPTTLKFRVVEFAPLDAATEAKMPPDMITK